MFGNFSFNLNGNKSANKSQQQQPGSVSSNCPGLHGLSLARIAQPHIVLNCNQCSGVLHYGMQVYQCRVCNYDLCCTCFANPPRAAPRKSSLPSTFVSNAMNGMVSAMGGMLNSAALHAQAAHNKAPQNQNQYQASQEGDDAYNDGDMYGGQEVQETFQADDSGYNTGDMYGNPQSTANIHDDDHKQAVFSPYVPQIDPSMMKHATITTTVTYGKQKHGNQAGCRRARASGTCVKCKGRGFVHEHSFKHDKKGGQRCFWCIDCTGCSGKGAVSSAKNESHMRCPKCRGKGFVHEHTFKHDTGPSQKCTWCETCTCGGSGYLYTG